MERKKFIDIAKGIGIIAVVAGHLFFWLPVPESYPGFLHFIHSFHMPLFFILAGVTFKIAKDAPVKTYLYKRLNGLIKPYVIWCLIVSFLRLLFDNHPNGLGAGEIAKIFIGPLVFSGNFLGSWFIICLFWAQLLTTVVFITLKDEWKIITGLLVLGVIGMLMPVTLPSGIFNNIHKFQRLDVALPAAMLIAIGALYFKDRINFGNHLYAVISALLLAASFFFNGFVNMNEYLYGGVIPLFITGSAAGTYLTLYISKKIEDYVPYLSGLLAYIGKNSLWILFYHEAFSRLLNYMLGVNKRAPVNMWLLVLYTAIPVLVPTAIIYLIDILKAHKKERDLTIRGAH